MKTAKTVLVMAVMAAMMPVDAQPTTNAEREAFLRTATVVSKKSLSMGVTNSSKAQMTDGTTAHAAHIQTVDIRKAQFQTDRGTELNFRDSSGITLPLMNSRRCWTSTWCRLQSNGKSPVKVQPLPGGSTAFR